VGVAIRHAQRDDVPALLALYGELNPDDPLLSAAEPPAHAFYAAQGFAASARGYRRYL
jgi:hypothetical protein